MAILAACARVWRAARGADGTTGPRSALNRMTQGRTPPSPRPEEPVFSVGQHVLVVGHRVHVVTGFVGVWTREALRRRSGRPACAEATAGRRVVPGAQVEIQSAEGRKLANQYAIEMTPTFIFFDTAGREQWRGAGLLDAVRVRTSMHESAK